MTAAPIELDPAFPNVWDELVWRGSVSVSTDEDALRAALGGEAVTFYVGFDPTAPSLHLGNLAQLIVLRRLQLAGHRALALVGGSTGLIGDPKPESERQLNDRDVVAGWVERLGEQVRRFALDTPEHPLQLVNNLDWTAEMNVVDYLREIGKHFRVSTMLSKDAVAKRMEGEGISYAEFSYQVLQGLDFRELFLRYGCTLQFGGQDQWGNLTAGTELIRKSEGAQVHAFGTPLITDETGRKFGKSEGNAVWLDAEMTSPYAMYQFWLNQDDAIVVTLLKAFTFLPKARIDELEAAVRDEPFRREAQRTLAYEVTAFVHGEDAADESVAASAALFGKGDVRELTERALASALASLPGIAAQPDTPVLTALVEAGLVPSQSEARRAMQQGAVQVNGEKVTNFDATFAGRFLHDRYAVLQRGKKELAAVTLAS